MTLTNWRAEGGSDKLGHRKKSSKESTHFLVSGEGGRSHEIEKITASKRATHSLKSVEGQIRT